MSETTAQAYVCDECGHIWLKTAKLPTHCAKCHTRKWNSGAKPPETAPLDVKNMPASVTIEHKREVKSVPISHSASALHSVAYSRPAHAQGCSCLRCKPSEPKTKAKR